MAKDPMDITDNTESGSSPIIDGNEIEKSLMLSLRGEAEDLMDGNLPMPIADVGLELADFAGSSQRCKALAQLIVYQNIQPILKIANEIALGTVVVKNKGQADMIKFLISKTIPNVIDTVVRAKTEDEGDGLSLISADIIEQIPINKSENNSENLN